MNHYFCLIYSNNFEIVGIVSLFNYLIVVGPTCVLFFSLKIILEIGGVVILIIYQDTCKSLSWCVACVYFSTNH